MNAFKEILRFPTARTTALSSGGGELTHEELARKVSQIGNSLLENGVRASDHVVLIAENSLVWVASYLAILKIGAVAIPISERILAETVGRLISWFDSHVVIMSKRALARNILSLPSGTSTFSDNIEVPDQYPDGITIRNLYSDDHRCEVVEVAPDSLASLMLTSGSTGAPRAVKISHRNIIANTTSIIAALGVEPADRMLCVLPFAYCFGTSLLHTHLSVGGSLALFNEDFSARAVLTALESTKSTSLAGVPSVFQTLLRRGVPTEVEWPKLRKIQQAGGRLPAPLIAELRHAFPEADVFIMYGQTEATARLSCLQPRLIEQKIGSVGKAIPGVKLEIISPSGQLARPGEVGEIVVQGENVAMGYWKDPTSTAQTFQDGQLHTGDMGYYDDDGFIYIVDRTKDFIKSAGFRCSSQEIEEYIIHIPGIVEVAVIGVPDRVRGEAVRAYIVRSENNAPSKSVILQYCRDVMPSYMVPKEIVFVNELHKNEYGKVLKSTLKDLAGVAIGRKVRIR